MIERGCGLHRLKDKDDLEESTLSGLVFPSSHKIDMYSEVKTEDKSWGSGLFFLGGKRSQNLELRSKKQSVGNTLRSWNKGKESQIRTPWPGSFGWGPEVRILMLGSRN